MALGLRPFSPCHVDRSYVQLTSTLCARGQLPVEFAWTQNAPPSPVNALPPDEPVSAARVFLAEVVAGEFGGDW